MSDETTRLNIERAREALSRARMDQVAAAVRAPRPADLSRLREAQERRADIDARAGAFRETVRARLGLGEYRGPGVPATSYVSQAMSTPLCDADICAPAPHPALDMGKVEVDAPEAAVEPAIAEAETAAPEAEQTAAPVNADAAPSEAAMTEAGDAYTPLPEGYVAAESPAPPPPPAQKKRRKFLGLF